MKDLKFEVKNLGKDDDLTEEELIKKYNINKEDFENFKYSCWLDSVFHEAFFADEE